jgi:branched-chain amino acid aminotransferase
MKYPISVELVEKSRISEVDFSNLVFGRNISDHMFVADYIDGEWTDCRIVPYGPMLMSPAIMALHYGQAIFEGMKANKDAKTGVPLLFRPEMHIERINRSAVRMAMQPIPDEIFMNALNYLLDIDRAWIPESEGSALYIRPHMFAIDATLGVKASDNYRFVIMTSPVGPYYPKPIRLLVSEKYVRAFPGGVGFAKAAGNYGATLAPAAQAKEKGFDQILWLDGIEFKYLQECGTMNIMCVIGDTVVTPNLTDTILAGITRDSILHLIRDLGLKIEERPISIFELIEANKSGELKEMFGTGTAAVLSHVSEFSYKDEIYTLPPLEGRKVGPMIKKVLEDYKKGIQPDKFNWLVPVKKTMLSSSLK